MPCRVVSSKKLICINTSCLWHQVATARHGAAHHVPCVPCQVQALGELQFSLDGFVPCDVANGQSLRNVVDGSCKSPTRGPSQFKFRGLSSKARCYDNRARLIAQGMTLSPRGLHPILLTWHKFSCSAVSCRAADPARGVFLNVSVPWHGRHI